MVKKIRYWVVKAIGISKGEANALLILCPILFLIIVLPPLFHDYLTKNYANHAKDQAILDSLLLEIENNRNYNDLSIKKESPTIYQPFDPNNASLDLLKSNGIPNHLAKRIINYREKGGTFRNKEDLQKIYGIEDKLYESLIPYIHIANIEKKPNTAKPVYDIYKKRPDRRVKIIPFDINNADTTTLKQIYGIGSKLSLRIIKFRKQLGGFIGTNQLYQVYGLQTQVIDSLLIYGSISPNFTPKKININNDSLQHLSQHPYVNYQLAKAIINFRKQHGNYTEVAQLKDLHLINDSIYHKISPYLKTSQ